MRLHPKNTRFNYLRGGGECYRLAFEAKMQGHRRRFEMRFSRFGLDVMRGTARRAGTFNRGFELGLWLEARDSYHFYTEVHRDGIEKPIHAWDAFSLGSEWYWGDRVNELFGRKVRVESGLAS